MTAVVLAALTFCGCSTKEYILLNDDQVHLVMNAQLNSEDTDHLVYLSLASADQGITLVKGGSVKVSVNGGAPVSAVEIPPEEGFPREANVYGFHQAFKPGDEVLFEGSDLTRNVSARVRVPDLPEVVSVDTLTVTRKGSDWFGDSYEQTSLQVKVKLRDRAGEQDYYRLSGYRVYDFPEGDRAVLLDWASGEPAIDEYTGEYVLVGRTDPIYDEQRLWVDVSEEPLISGEQGEGDANAMIAELFDMENDWCVFTDASFEGEEYTLRLYLNQDSFGYYGYLGPCSVEDYLRVHAISFEQFHYLKAVSASNASSFFSEPVSMPTNVEGGLGFVTIESSVRVPVRPFDLIRYEFDPETNTYHRLAE